ncbi:organomercurial lyase [Streptomyces sp. NPDC001728]|uniref:organomercurial lyase n=1 Tax=Streptomyces sp. NPDC001728 TaxID=3154396 RepID=UPI00332759E9
MCAVDALGVPAMLGRDAVIFSSDPVTGEPVTVTSTGGTTVWEPASAVVFVGRRGFSGTAEAVCCDPLNFFTSPASATTWPKRHPDVPATTSPTRPTASWADPRPGRRPSGRPPRARPPRGATGLVLLIGATAPPHGARARTAQPPHLQDLRRNWGVLLSGRRGAGSDRAAREGMDARGRSRVPAEQGARPPAASGVVSR